jgi:3-oxoacyl-[acyl-carrier-protein] synthase III
VLTNADLEQLVETDDQWITERTGIKERRIAGKGESTNTLAVRAARRALASAGLGTGDVEFLIVATVTPDYPLPSAACVLQGSLQMGGAAMDVGAGCAGFLYGLATGAGLIDSGVARTVLVVGAETLSRITDYTDRSTCILFGDGAGAAVVAPVADGGILGFELGADGSGGPDLCVPAGGSRRPINAGALEEEAQFIKMNGAEVFRFATRVMVSSAEELLAACGAGVEDVDLYVPHQANKRIIDHAVKNLGLDPGKVLLNIDRYGNTSSASIPIGLAEAQADGLLQEGTRVLMSAVGAGLTWGSVYMTWTLEGTRR